MEFFSDHWVLWTCFFVPALAWLRFAKLVNAPVRGEDAARLVAWTAGTLLVIAAIHVAVGLLLP